ncbi:MAG: PilN domain-containing protein [Pseudomonadota bacterium]
MLKRLKQRLNQWFNQCRWIINPITRLTVNAHSVSIATQRGEGLTYVAHSDFNIEHAHWLDARIHAELLEKALQACERNSALALVIPHEQAQTFCLRLPRILQIDERDAQIRIAVENLHIGPWEDLVVDNRSTTSTCGRYHYIYIAAASRRMMDAWIRWFERRNRPLTSISLTSKHRLYQACASKASSMLGVPMFWTKLAGAMTITALLAYMQMKQVHQKCIVQQGIQNTLAQEVSMLEGQIKKTEGLTEEQAKLRAAIRQMQQADAAQFYMLHVLAALSNTIPDDVQLTVCTRSGSEVVLSGVARDTQSVAQWLHALTQRADMFIRPHLKNIQKESQQKEGVAFTIELQLLAQETSDVSSV